MDGANKISESFKKAGITGSGLDLNVAQSESIDKAFEVIKEKFGMPTILVNNAAITQDNLLLRMKDEEWEGVIETNLNSIFRVY